MSYSIAKDLEIEGWSVIRSAVPVELVSSIEEWLKKAEISAEQGGTLEPEFENKDPSVMADKAARKLRRLFWNDIPFWRDALSRAGIFDIANNVIGPDAVMTFNAAFLKPPKVGSHTAFHQDQYLWQFTYPKALNVWMPLKPATVDNGCIQVCSKSHLRGLLPHLPLENHPFHNGIDTLACGLAPQPVEMEPGDLLVWDRYLVHGSAANLSPKARPAVVSVFVDPNVEGFKTTDSFHLSDLRSHI